MNTNSVPKIMFDPAKLKLVDPKTLTVDPKNRNKHPPDQIERFCKLLQTYGMRWPILVSELTGVIKAGEGRLLAALKLKMPQVLVSYQEFENSDIEYGFGISDNAIAAWAELDLSGINTDIGDLGPDWDIDLLGIKDFVIEPLDKLEPGCDEDEVPEVKESFVKLGDIWQLGSHRLMCGDATSIDDVERLMNGEKADMVFTDPPYNVNYGVDNTSNPAGWSSSNRNIKNDHMSSEEYFQFSQDICGSISVITEGCVYLCAAPGKDGRIIFRALDEAFHCSTTIIWNKSSMVMGRGKYHNKYEPIWFGWVKDGTHFIDDRTLVNVWAFDRPHRSDLHPTMKPVELIEQAINHASKKSVADPFGGSGSTLIACEKTNRRCFMMELDPHYCGVIVERWQKYSGKEAVRLDG